MIRKELFGLVERQEPGIQVKESVYKGIRKLCSWFQNWTAFMKPELEEIKVKKEDTLWKCIGSYLFKVYSLCSFYL